MNEGPYLNPQQELPVAIEAVERWTDLARAMTLYEDNNTQVLELTESFLEALRKAVGPEGGKLEVTFTDETLRAGEESFDLRSRMKSWSTPANEKFAWVKSRLDRAQLAGVVFDASLEPASLTAFSRRLLDLFVRRDLQLTFEELWVEEYPGLKPLERRFEGGFAGRDGDGDETRGPNVAGRGGEGPTIKRTELSQLSLELLRNSEVKAAIDRIVVGVERVSSSGGGVNLLELLECITELMPADLVQDGEAAARLAAEILGDIADGLAGEELLASVSSGDTGYENLSELMLKIAPLHFSRATAARGQETPEPDATSSDAGEQSASPPDARGPAPRALDLRLAEQTAQPERPERPESGAPSWGAISSDALPLDVAETGPSAPGLPETGALFAGDGEVCLPIDARSEHEPEPQPAEPAQPLVEEEPPRESPDPPAPEPEQVTHEGDDAIEDDVDAMLVELEAFAPLDTRPIDARRVEDRAEQLGVYLHHLVTLDDAEQRASLQDGIGELLWKPNQAELDVLGEYLQPLLSEEELPPGLDLARVARVVRSIGRASLLRQCGILGPEWIVREFPQEFLAYIDTLDFDVPKDLQELDQVCQRIGPERFRAEPDLLTGQREFLKSRTCKRIFMLPLESTAPFARLIFEKSRRLFKREFGMYVHARMAKGIDKALLDVIGDSQSVFTEYLIALVEGNESKLRGFRQSLLYSYVVATDGDPRRVDRRIRAIRLLANFDTPVIQKLLERLARGRKFLVMKEQPKPIRQAAREVLRSFRAA